MTVYLPNKKGAYRETRIPNYILEILENVRPCKGVEIGHYGLYTYFLRGVNPIRPCYGIPNDLRRLEAWAKRYHADFKIMYEPGFRVTPTGYVRINSQPKNYYGIFQLTDPVAHQLEKAGVL